MQKGMNGASFAVLITVAAVALGGCAARHSRAPGKTRPAPLHFCDEETGHLISMALSVAVDGRMGDCPGDTCMVLNTVYVYHHGFSYESLSATALPASTSSEFILVSREDIIGLPAEDNKLHYIEISRVVISDDDATVDVSFWSVPSKGLGRYGSAKGPSLLFRRSDGAWAFVEVKGWVNIN